MSTLRRKPQLYEELDEVSQNLATATICKHSPVDADNSIILFVHVEGEGVYQIILMLIELSTLVHRSRVVGDIARCTPFPRHMALGRSLDLNAFAPLEKERLFLAMSAPK